MYLGFSNNRNMNRIRTEDKCKEIENEISVLLFENPDSGFGLKLNFKKYFVLSVLKSNPAPGPTGPVNFLLLWSQRNHKIPIFVLMFFYFLHLYVSDGWV